MIKVGKVNWMGEGRYILMILLTVVAISLLIAFMRVQRGLVGILLMIVAIFIFIYWFREIKKMLRSTGHRDFIYEVMEEGNSIMIVAQVPGPERDVMVLSKGKKLIVRGGGGFKRALILRSNARVVQSTYKNGILTVKLEKMDVDDYLKL